MKPLLATLLACVLAGCADPRGDAGRKLKQVGPEQLRRDAALLYKRLFAGHGRDFVIVRASEWPASFRSFALLRVGAYPDGISLTLTSRSGSEEGLYIIPATMEQKPAPTERNRFERLAEGVYWYSFGE